MRPEEQHQSCKMNKHNFLCCPLLNLFKRNGNQSLLLQQNKSNSLRAYFNSKGLISFERAVSRSTYFQNIVIYILTYANISRTEHDRLGVSISLTSVP